MNKQLTEVSGPKYLQIKETLGEEIAQGVYKVGEKIPSENVLPKRFKVSKMTVVKAIDELVRDGILDRVRGSGTYVSAKSKPVTLNVGLFGDNSWILDEFEREYPEIKLNRIVYSHENIIEVSDNCDIDVFYLTDYAFGYFKAHKRLLDLTEAFEKEIFEEHLFFDEVMRMFEHRRKQYGIPVLFSPLVMYFNKKLFDEAGVAYPEDTWSREEFLAKAKALTMKPDANGIVPSYGFLMSQYRNRWPVYVLQEGGSIMDDDGKTALVGSPEVVAALKWVGELLHKHKVCPVFPYMNDAMSQELFLNNRAAMLMGSYYSIRHFLNLDCCIAPLPMGKCDVTGLIADSLAVSAKCQNVDAAVKLIKFAVSEKIQKKLKLSAFGLPSRKATALSYDDIPEGINSEEYFSFLEFFPKGKGRKLLDVSEPKLLAPFWKHADMVWANMESAESACALAQKEIDELSKENGK